MGRRLGRFGVVAVASLLFTAYSAGVTYGHWSVEAHAAASGTTGTLGLAVTDPPPGFTFDCGQPGLPRKAISFLWFWDPLLEPGPLTPAGSGAVKIEEDGIELGPGPYSVTPPDASLGDPLTVHLGTVTVEVVSWVEKPGEPGEYVGFHYIVSPGDAEVVLDVKAGPGLTRHFISGSGMWPPVGLFPGAGPGSCEQGESVAGRLDACNIGTLPVGVILEWHYGFGADPGDCALFDVVIRAGSSAEILYEGPLCDLVGNQITASPALDPGECLWLDFEVVIAPGASISTEVNLPMIARVVYWLWNGDPPGSPPTPGWWGAEEEPFEIAVVGLPSPSANAPQGLEPPPGPVPGNLKFIPLSIN